MNVATCEGTTNTSLFWNYSALLTAVVNLVSGGDECVREHIVTLIGVEMRNVCRQTFGQMDYWG